MRIAIALSAVLFICLGQPSASFASDIRESAVKFDTGKSGASIKDRIKGYESVSYKLGAKAGQIMDVSLSTKHGATYFNVYAPGKGPGGEAILTSEMVGQNGVTDINKAQIVLPADGTYIISVYMMRSAARRNEVADYTLDVSIGASGAATQLPLQPGDMLAGKDFDASGNVPCARYKGQPMNSCAFGVKREGNGNGYIKIDWFDGGNRVIFFEDNTPVRYDQSEADGGAKMTVTQEADLYMVRIGDQRFEIVEAVMTGG